MQKGYTMAATLTVEELEKERDIKLQADYIRYNISNSYMCSNCRSFFKRTDVDALQPKYCLKCGYFIRKKGV